MDAGTRSERLCRRLQARSGAIPRLLPSRLNRRRGESSSSRPARRRWVWVGGADAALGSCIGRDRECSRRRGGGPWIAIALCLVVGLTSCEDQSSEGDAGSPTPHRNDAIREAACIAVEDLLPEVVPYLGGQENGAALRRSALQLADASGELATFDPDHSHEFVLAGIVAFAFRDYERAVRRDPAAPANTDLGSVWAYTTQIVARTCGEWGISVDLGTSEGGD